MAFVARPPPPGRVASSLACTSFPAPVKNEMDGMGWKWHGTRHSHLCRIPCSQSGGSSFIVYVCCTHLCEKPVMA